MDNNQSRQEQSSELSYSSLARASRREIALAGCNSLLALIKHRPSLVLSGVWGFLIAIAAIAVLSLTNTGRVEQQETTPTPVAATPVPAPAQPDAAWLDHPAKTSSQTSSPMRLWLLGAVVLTCGAGSVVIYKRLNRSSQPRRRQHAQRLTRSTEHRRRKILPVPASAPVQPPVPAEAAPLSQEIQPLDSGSESLAEMMDIRKQRSLSSILGDL